MLQYNSMGGLQRLVVLLACLSALHAGANQDARPQFRGLANIEVLNTNAFERSSAPHLSRFDNQRVAMVYTDTVGGMSAIYYSFSENNGKTWTKPLSLSTGYGTAREPLLLIDATGKAFVFFSAGGAIYEAESIDKGKTWTKPLKVSSAYVGANSPAAVLTDSGDIHLVWESAGKILYRSYAAQVSTWSTVIVINTDDQGSQPAVTCFNDKLLYVAWVAQGEIVFKQLDLPSKEWGSIEPVSLDSLVKLKAIAGGSSQPALAVDQTEKVHIVWTNKNQIIHRIRNRGNWQSAHSRLSNKYFAWTSQPSLVADQLGMIYVCYVENNAVVINQYSSLEGRWQKTNRVAPKSSVVLFSSILVGNTSVTAEGVHYQSGYDLAWVERSSSSRSLKAKLLFHSQAVFANGGNGPVIKTVTNENGLPAIAWKPAQDQAAVQVILNNRPTPEAPVVYDSKAISGPETAYLVNNINLSLPVYYIFIRTQNLQGEWSAWSAPYQFKTVADTAGPELEVTGIDEDSLYLYSPDPTLIYYGKGLLEPKEFVIRGTVKDKGSGVRKLTFSPAFGNAPPSLYDLSGENWAVRYTVKSKDEPATIIVTAYDNEGQYTSKVISVVKDSAPPEPPTWTKVFRNQQFTAEGVSQGVVESNSRTFFATWQNSTDAQSGLRYHLMGVHPKWWQDQVHTSGDSEKGVEGLNTVHVFAVDNVGNISLPGTARIFIDSLPPDQPTVATTITSSNYFIGLKSLDTVDILVNGQHEDDMEMISSTNWRYRHRFNEGEQIKFSLQAVDALKNKSRVRDLLVIVDKTPPRVYAVEHNAGERILRAKDTVLFTARGDVSSNAFVRLGGLAPLGLYDDGTRGDAKAQDGLYSVLWEVPENLQGTLDIVASFYDAAGNLADRSGPRITIDSLAPQTVDVFEEEGDHYPWKNHCQAENIFPARETDPGVEPPEGKSVLRIDYDLKDQGWAGLSAEEFKPRNYYGARPYISFWLKGSGGHARIMVVLQGQQRRDVDFRDPQLKQYSITLADKRWQRVSIPVPNELKDPMSATVKYTIYIFSDEEKEAGTVYMDDLRVTYKPEAVERKLAAVKPQTYTGEAVIPRSASQVFSGGEMIPAPYLQLELSPQPLVKGKTVTIKVTMPKEIAAQRAYAVFGTRNGEPQKAVLKPVAGTMVWSGTYALPADALNGEQFGIFYVQDNNNTVFKKMFTYKIVDAQASIYDQIVARVDPHPAIAGKDMVIKLRIPLAVKSSQVMVFFGADQQKVYSVALTKTAVKTDELWSGVTTIPEAMPAGNYSANVLIKTKNNSFVRTTLAYAVIAPAQ